ncbi:g4435 [Coccomyxa viridis]|uniref:G4435 protein n=1 Tax=Coccomyxa viridis TaxID=1274662 RepID=A0ABP1FSJ6_9CHLO
MAFALSSGSLSVGSLQSRRFVPGSAALRLPSSRTRQAFVVAQRPSYKAPTKFGSNSGLKGTGTGADPEEVQQKSQEIIRDIQAKWNATEEKPAVIAIGLSSFVAIWAASGLVDAINRLPLINGVLEGVGLVVTGWFVYRNLIFGPDREELRKNIDDFLKKVTGKMDASVSKASSSVKDTLNK